MSLREGPRVRAPITPVTQEKSDSCFTQREAHLIIYPTYPNQSRAHIKKEE